MNKDNLKELPEKIVAENIELSQDVAEKFTEADTDQYKELKSILKLYAAKRRGEETPHSFDEIKALFKEHIGIMITAGNTAFKPGKLVPFSKELFDEFCDYDERESKFYIQLKVPQAKESTFAYFKQWWKSKFSESNVIENFIIALDNGTDLYINQDLLGEKFKEGVFYIKNSQKIAEKVKESLEYVPPGSELNITNMASWVKKIDAGSIKITESSELEQLMVFSGEKIKGEYIAKRTSKDSDFWVLNKKT